MKVSRSLVVFSVPYTRIARVLLSNNILNAIRHRADIVVVGPFDDDDAFLKSHVAQGIRFLRFDHKQEKSRFLTLLYAISETLRTVGYWFSYRRNGLDYYWKIQQHDLGIDGQDTKKPMKNIVVRKVLGVVGSISSSWRLIDAAIGRYFFRFPSLDEIVGSYDQVSLIQAASWGMQDRLLAWYARKFGWRTVLIPYTTDQIWINGYLLCDYSTVCAQGSFEQRCAINYHSVPKDRISTIGSMWFRSIDEYYAKHQIRNSPQEKQRRQILYAGVAREFFPRESEYDALTALLAAGEKGRFGEYELIYRPYITDANERSEVVARVSAMPGVALQFTETDTTSLTAVNDEGIEHSTLSYLRRIAAADVLVMSHTTSLGWDAAYLGCGVIANFADATGVLARRNTHLRFLPGVGLDCAPGLPVAHSLDQLVDLVAEQLRDPAARASSGRGILAEWDAPATDLPEMLARAIFGPQSESSDVDGTT